ncbi:hypothetical protein PMAYCL1PPCAC_17429, partial [Pristionchus mayeri]
IFLHFSPFVISGHLGMVIILILCVFASSFAGVLSFYTPVERLMFFDHLFERTIHNGTVKHKWMEFEGNLYFWNTSNHSKHYKFCEHRISDSRFTDVSLNGSHVSSIFLQCVKSLECCELKCCEKASLATILVRYSLLAIIFFAIFICTFECLRFSTVKILSKLRQDDECQLVVSTIDGGYLNPEVDVPSDKVTETTAEKRRLLMKKYESLHEAVEHRNILSEAAVPLCSPIAEEPLVLPPSSPANWHLRQMTRV